MRFLLLVPVALSLLVLGAHFLRGGGLVLAGVMILLLLLLALRRPWVARLTQAALVLGGLEWVGTLRSLARARVAAGEPVLRMAVILGTVAALTLLSALLFETATLGRLFGLDAEDPIGEAEE